MRLGGVAVLEGFLFLFRLRTLARRELASSILDFEGVVVMGRGERFGVGGESRSSTGISVST